MPDNREHLSIVPSLGVIEDAITSKTAALPDVVTAELDLLTPQELEVSRLRTGLDIGMTRTHAEVARELGMLVPSVALSEIRALNKLRDSGNARVDSQSDTI